MKLTDRQRSDIETALDEMAMELMACGRFRKTMRRQYVKAIRSFRDIPSGHRRVRSDFVGGRQRKQQELDIQ